MVMLARSAGREGLAQAAARWAFLRSLDRMRRWTWYFDAIVREYN
jgi:hypothetical protein